MTEDINTLWNYEVQDSINSIAISRTGDFIFVGGREGVLYCIERSGYVLWKGNVEGEISALVLVEAVQCVLVGSHSGKIYRWNYQGHLLEILDNGGVICKLSSTPTIHRIAVGTIEGTLSLYTANGQLMWQRLLPASIRHLALTHDARMLVLTCEDHQMYCFDGLGNQRWHVTTNNGDGTKAILSTSASCILTSSQKQHVSCFDRSGHLYWSNDIQAEVNCIALTPDGRLMTAGDNRQQIWLWRQNGELIWKASTPEEARELAISQDGRFVVVGTNKRAMIIFDAQGHLLWKQHMDAQVKVVAMTANGRLIAAVTADNSVLLVENRLADEDVEAWEAGRLIRDMRHLATQNEHMGVARWFDSFDQALREHHLEVCEQLAQELRQEGYQLKEEEWRWVDSREGTLWLYQGLHYQQQHEEKMARREYERSRERQRHIHYLRGEGQAISALSTLEAKQSRSDATFFSLQTDPPELLGNGEALLLQRIKNAPEEEQRQIILAAQQHGYLSPLLAALSSSHPPLQAVAAAALTNLRPGPELNTLLEMLVNPHWLVRWQATLMLEQHVSQMAKELSEPQEPMHRALLEQLLQESDPLVQEALIPLIDSSEGFTHLPAISSLLSDPDPNVRMASIKALGKTSTLRTAAMLQYVADGRDFHGYSISEVVREISQQIVQQHPPAQIKHTALYKVSATHNEPMRPATLFFSHEALIQCVIVCTGALPRTKIHCTFKGPNKQLWQQEQWLDEANMTIDEKYESTNGIRTLDWQATSIEEVWTKATFSFPAPPGNWPIGNYEVKASLEIGIQHKSYFVVINAVKIKHIVTCSSVSTVGEPLNEVKTFTRGKRIYCSILIEETPAEVDVLGSIYKIEKKVNGPSSLNRTFLHRFYTGMQPDALENLSFVSQQTVKTSKEGRQNIIFIWDTVGWEAGMYKVQAQAIPGKEVKSSFKIVL